MEAREAQRTKEMRQGDKVVVQLYKDDGYLHDYTGIVQEKEFPLTPDSRYRVTLDHPEQLACVLIDDHALYGGLYFSKAEMRPAE